MDIGFLGVGRMGQAMAANLVKAGHRVRAFDRSPDGLRAAEKLGMQPVASAREATGDVLISMLPNDEALRQVFVEDDVLAHGERSTISINMGTVSLDCVDELVALHAAKGRPYLAATVFGRPDVAAAGKLAIMVAGDGELIDRVQPL